MKIRSRLTIQFIAISVVIFSIALVFIFQLFRRYVENEFYTYLEHKGQMTASMVLQKEQELMTLGRRPADTAGVLPQLGNISIYNDKFECVFTLDSGSDFIGKSWLEKIPVEGVYRFSNGAFEAVGVSMVAPSGRRYLVVAEEQPDFSKLEKLRTILFLAFFLVIAIVAIGGWFYAGQALLPVSYIVNEVEAILPANLSLRLKKSNNRDEISHLADTFNRLLDRIEQAFQLQRGFISNVSHELKNPLAIMDAQLQLALNKPRSAEEYDRVLMSLHEDVRELSETIDRLLYLAKIHSGSSPAAFCEIRLDELVYQAKANLLKAHPGYTVSIEIRKLPETERDLCLSGNEFLLRTAILNLLENCCKFSPDHKARVVIDFEAEFPLSIEDDGPGIPKQDLPFIFEPFYRGRQTSRQKGSGIGLSLVRSILELHRFEWKVSSDEGKGTKFQIAFLKKEGQPLTHLSENHKHEVQANRFWNKRLRQLTQPLIFICFAVFASNCSDSVKAYQSTDRLGLEVIQEWNALFLNLVKGSYGYKAPVSARMFAYVGLAAWESARPAEQEMVPMAIRFTALDLPELHQGDFCAPAALNATYFRLAHAFFPNAPQPLLDQVTRLARKWDDYLEDRFKAHQLNLSAGFGEQVAMEIFKWSVSDSIGHKSYESPLQPYVPTGNGHGEWLPSGQGSPKALLPNWGHARTFLVGPGSVVTKAPVSFSEKPHTACFKQALEVYSTNYPVTREKKDIGLYWSNDYPLISYCPASRWIAIAHQVIEQEKPSLPATLEIYLKVGLALNDAAVKVWKDKYLFRIERPVDFIRRNIDSSWSPLGDTPQFPSYPSGHSIFGAAAAAVLEASFGKSYPLTDHTNDHMGSYNLEPRTFDSFDAMAKENALSRIYLGVHYRTDCEEGLRLGRIIGHKVADMNCFATEKLAVRQP